MSALFGDLLVVGAKNGSFTLDVDRLDEESLMKIAQFLALTVVAPGPWSQPKSKIGKGVAKRLLTAAAIASANPTWWCLTASVCAR